jgi:hypothetical protein
MLFVFLWRRYRTASLATGTVFGSIVTVLAVVVAIRIVLAVHSFGIWVNPLGGLGNKSLSGAPADSEAIYGAFHGRPLTVLIYRPHKPQSYRNPVMVYVHGGGWIEGTADQRSKEMFSICGTLLRNKSVVRWPGLENMPPTMVASLATCS